MRRLLELIHEITGHGGVEEVMGRFSVELGALEDAYITSRYIAREYRLEDVERFKKVVDEVVRVVEEATGRRGEEEG